ncbi:hypothetical protein [Kribbella kalugense]|uniref:Phage baseplate protein n=1 Tax=Kribbella kalugense TaxID=2512221 RepID=A0A4V3G899_9ACTN|nr:hypothetical protein [Kribbella kalugense]TDW22074.1 hypothetical protein EV650_0906 [Kribbella kalugense]
MTARQVGLLAPAALDVWEAGLSMTPAARALLLLGAAGHRDAADWAVGERDRALIRDCVPLGRSLDAVTDCPVCGAQLDVELDPAALVTPTTGDSQVSVEYDGYRVVARLPTGADLAQLPGSLADEELRRTLLERCILSADLAGNAVAELPEAVELAVESALEEADPGADIRLALSCAECGAEWSESLDPVRFAWTSVETAARRLAVDVHVLAQAYGWSEAEILGLSPFRRRLYLSAVQP